VSSEVDGVITDYLLDKNRDYAQVLEERDDVGSLMVSYVYGDDLISQERGGNIFYYQYDGHMSTRALTNASGSVTDEYTYDAFGSLTDQAGTTVNNYLYSGEQYDPNVGFYYLRARYYDSSVGRFLTTDPAKGNKFDPASFHKYLYANANPVMFSDPSGKMSLGELSEVQKIISVLMLASMTQMAINSMQNVHIGTRTRVASYNLFYHGTDSVSAASIVAGGPSVLASPEGFYTVRLADKRYAYFKATMKAEDFGAAIPAVVEMKLDSRMFSRFLSTGSVLIRDQLDMARGEYFEYTEYVFLPQTYYLLKPPTAIFSID